MRESGWYWVKVLLTPGCWLQNYRYSQKWDKHLRELLAANRFTFVDSFTARLGDWEVWIENHPYASFTPYNNGKLGIRPSRATMLYAFDRLLADTEINSRDDITARHLGI